MKIMKKNFLSILFIIQLALLATGQVEPVTNPAGAEIVRQEESGRGRNQDYPRRPQFKRIGEQSKEGKALLTPSEKDFAEYRQFLKLSKTAITKIFSAAECNRLVVNAADEKCLRASQMLGQGAYYSFRSKNNHDIFRFDIYFADGNFSNIASPQNFGFFVDLGDIPIESLDKNSPQLANLKNYHLPKTEDDLRRENVELKDGLKAGNDFLTAKIGVKFNKTYGLRLANWTDRYYGGEDKDLLIVLRVVRENEDGSIIFIWRELQRKGISKLKKSS